MRYGLLLGAIAACVMVGCGADAEKQRPIDRLPAGSGLPADLQEILYAQRTACRTNEDCVSGLCRVFDPYRGGYCMGLLKSESPWMIPTLTERFRERIAAQPAVVPRLQAFLRNIATRKENRWADRAHALRTFEAMQDRATLREIYPNLPEPLGELAAFALTRLGDLTAMAHVAALTESDQPVLAVEALDALGQSGRPEALVPLLRSLSPDLEPPIMRGALDGIARLGDKRAIGPLVDFLADAPAHLLLRTTDALRALNADNAGAKLPADLDAWRAHLKSNPPEPAPAYKARTRSSEEDLGIPTP